jgi:hypothetical protein
LPKDGGSLILMECKVKSPQRPTAKWYVFLMLKTDLFKLRSKDGVPLTIGGLYQDIFTDLGDGTYLLQLEIRVCYK